jgi:Arc/MetJ family transcription regulator
MSTRLQVVMSDEEHEELRQAAGRARVTVSEWVRRALREARERPIRGPGAVREAPSAYGAPPSGHSGRVHVEMDLKEDLLETVRQRYRQPNWRAAVEYALRRAAVSPMTRDEALAMRGAGWEGDLGAMRAGDPGATW